MDDKIKFSRKLHIATGASRKTKTWKNREVEWSALAVKLQTASKTGETVAEYQALKKIDRDRAKDVGGFVGGYLDNGRRLTSRVRSRSMLTLDADQPQESFKSDLDRVLGSSAYVLYSTHSHTEDSPRYRVIVPLSRDVEPDEYQAVSRKVADDIGMDHFDPTTFDVARLFYWPSTPQNGTYEYDLNDAPLLNPDTILASYVNWSDCTAWPTSSNEAQARKRDIRKQGEPTDKPGLIGAFCRVYSVQAAIDKYLQGVYEPTDDPDRYTYAAGTSTGGLVVYDDKFAFSHHGTDPASGLDCNAFDLVRIHLYGIEDESAEADTPVNKLPSFKEMMQLADKDEKVHLEYAKSEAEEIRDAWNDGMITEDGAPTVANDDWLGSLTHSTKRGAESKFESTPQNVLLILSHDPLIAGLPAYDKFSHRVVSRGALPWRKSAKGTIWTDADDACLRNYLSKYYGITGKQIIDDALTETVNKNKFHPVRDYLDSLCWDGTPRIDRLYIDYLGAEDTEYTRTITRTHLRAAIARIYRPGCKFDNCLVLYGAQGIGKSTLLSRLGGPWFNDSIANIQNKDALEQLQGSWCIELQEMQATNRAGNDQIKAFLSKQVDKFRVAYGRRTEEYPRQCIFFATTNEDICLKDRTGGRRFWILDCTGEALKSVLDMTDEERDQIWAEAKNDWDSNKNLRLPADVEARAREIQEAKTEGSELLGLIKGYLDTPVPKNWNKMSVTERRYFMENGELEDDDDGKRYLMVRTCAMAIWCECLGGNRLNFNNAKAREINTILASIDGLERYKKNKTGKLWFAGYGSQRAYIRTEEDIAKHMSNSLP